VRVERCKLPVTNGVGRATGKLFKKGWPDGSKKVQDQGDGHRGLNAAYGGGRA